MPRTASPAPARPHRALRALLAACLASVPACAPPHLADTGLGAAFAAGILGPDVVPFSPQDPPGNDGAEKRRWMSLPPVDTRLGKEFAFGRAVEPRSLLRAAVGSWLYANYLKTPDGSDAVLAPENGVRGVCATAGGRGHDVPSVADCRLCHENGRSP